MPSRHDSTGLFTIVRSRSTLLGGAILTVAGVVFAFEDTTLDIERVDGTGWHAEGVRARLELSRNGTTKMQASVSRLSLDSPAQELRNVRIDCPRAHLSNDVIACDQATIDVVLPALGPQSLRGRVAYTRVSGNLDVALEGVRVAQGRAGLKLSLQDTGWRTEVVLKAMPIDGLVGAGRKLVAALPEFTATGLVTMTLSAHGTGGAVASARVEGSLANFTANNQAGTLATDKLSLAFNGTFERRAGAWGFQAEARSEQGQAYAQPVFLDFGAHAIALRVGGNWNDAAKVLSIEHFDIDHREVSRGEGRVTLAFGNERPLRSLALKLERLTFPGAYESYLQPLLLDTNFKALTTSGSIAGIVSVENGDPQQVELHFDRLSLDDGAGNFVVNGLNGDWHWRNRPQRSGDVDDDARVGDPVAASLLRWQDATLLHLGVGQAELAFETSGRQFRLLRPSRIPVLDGAIDLESLRVRNVGLPGVAFIIDATIEPISAARLCKAFDWPAFGGQVGGTVSKLRMRDGVITLGTTLEAQVFDGRVTISDLRLEQPFGQWPKFSSNITLANLDLELVTGAFSFGRITGRLSGEIGGLQLFNWTPVAFDARLYTPDGDRSRHRISQRAVENIGSIGGGGAGVTAALSSGFLRFFDDFNYETLGISCRLAKEVCVMDGVAAAPNGGYYLVKGRGVPRIDVIGSSKRVDWPRLVRQLIAATRSEGPVVN